MIEEENKRVRDVTLARVAEVVIRCPHFQDEDWDWCNTNCELYDFCDKVYTSQNVSKVIRK